MPEEIDKKSLSERDICTKYITPALVNRGWDIAIMASSAAIHHPSGHFHNKVGSWFQRRNRKFLRYRQSNCSID